MPLSQVARVERLALVASKEEAMLRVLERLAALVVAAASGSDLLGLPRLVRDPHRRHRRRRPGRSWAAEVDHLADLGHPVGLFQQRVNILAGRASGAFLLPLGGMASLLSFLVRVARRRIVRPAEKSKAVPNLQNRSAEFRFCRQLLPHDQPASAGSSNTWR